MKQQWIQFISRKETGFVCFRPLRIVLFLTAILLFIQPKIARAEEWPNPNNGSLQITVDNNLLQFDDFFSDAWDKDICNLNSIPDQVMSYEVLNLSVPIQRGSNGEWGFYLKYDQKLQGLGDTVSFYRDAMNLDAVTGRIYDLRGEMQKYKAAGLFKSYVFEQGGFTSVIRGNFFGCFDYRSNALMGMGILDPEAATDKITIYANYRESYLKEGSSPGLGLNLAWSTQAKWDSGLIMRLDVANFPGFIYFPSLTTKISEVDTVEETLSPMNFNGFAKDQPTTVQLPIEATGSVLMPVSSNGSLEFNASYSKLFQNYAIGYLYNLKKGIVKVEISPTMEDITFGYMWPWGKVQLSYMPLNGVVNGVQVGVKF